MAQAERRVSTVGDLVSKPAVAVDPDDEVTAAAQRMVDKSIGSVVVVDDDRTVGILTERDLVRFAATGGTPTLVRDWMTPDPDTTTPDEQVQRAVERLVEGKYRHLPVVSEGALVGMVSMRDLFGVAQIAPVQDPFAHMPKGLEGVPVAETTLSDVRGREGFFHYREYDAIAIARKRSFEDAWFLLHEPEHRLPDPEEREAFTAEVRALRHLPDEVLSILPAIARLGERFDPLEALRTAYAAYAASQDFRPWLDVGEQDLRRQARLTCAVFPTLVTALYRLRQGLDPVPPREDLDHATNYLYMQTGELPDPQTARAVDQYLTITIDHGFNASTFTTRIVASTGADLASCVMGGLGALSGPLHGGAPSRALDMIDEIGTPERADEWLRETLLGGGRLMGFGHRVYRTEDPRSVLLRELAEQTGDKRVEFARYVEERAIALLRELRPGREIYTNVEFYAGVLLDVLGIPRELFTPSFAASRVVGWTAHILEQSADNRLIRPSANYMGPTPGAEVPDPA